MTVRWILVSAISCSALWRAEEGNGWLNPTFFEWKSNFVLTENWKPETTKKPQTWNFAAVWFDPHFLKDFFWEQIDWFLLFLSEVWRSWLYWLLFKKWMLFVSHSHFFFVWQFYLGAANFIPITLPTWTSLFVAGGSLAPLKVTKTGTFGASQLVIGYWALNYCLVLDR